RHHASLAPLAIRARVDRVARLRERPPSRPDPARPLGTVAARRTLLALARLDPARASGRHGPPRALSWPWFSGGALLDPPAAARHGSGGDHPGAARVGGPSSAPVGAPRLRPPPPRPPGSPPRGAAPPPPGPARQPVPAQGACGL